ncbi:MAG: DUF4845 domain-containing protein [Saccharospirillaceae bacterium]|nr:DUF4845 domain-containing protein [Pseudomonadales bacterium]NRB79078.1 DUF4845 domain-containing protein [Saccharospirillaceae bacterium]
MIQSQKGASLLSIGILIAVVLFFAKFGIEVIPKYLTQLEYVKHIESTISKFEPNTVITKNQFYGTFNRTVKTSNWNRRIQDDVTFVRKNDQYEITLDYITTSNLFFDIDVSIHFNEVITFN